MKPLRLLKNVSWFISRRNIHKVLKSLNNAIKNSSERYLHRLLNHFKMLAISLLDERNDELYRFKIPICC